MLFLPFSECTYVLEGLKTINYYEGSIILILQSWDAIYLYIENIKGVLYELWKYCHHLRLITIQDRLKEAIATKAF